MSEEIEHNWRKAQHYASLLGVAVTTEEADTVEARLKDLLGSAMHNGYSLGLAAGREEIVKLCEENYTVLAGAVARSVRTKLTTQTP
jgi:hypothetical protein